MANAVMTWCDAHLQEKDERVPGAEYLLQVSTNGARSDAVVLDLCADCAAPLSAVAELAAAYGRRPGNLPQIRPATRRRPHRQQQARRVPANHLPTPDRVDCPVCGAVYPDRKRLGEHCRLKHDAPLTELEGTSKGLVCLLCEPHQKFETARGLAVHIGHGFHRTV